MDIAVAQTEMRQSFAGGGVGAIWSATVWLAAGLATSAAGIGTGFAVLFFGGMTIFPAASVLCRSVLRRPAPSKSNPLGRIALESTIAMVAMLLVGYALLPSRPDLVLPIAAIAVGTHYFAFASVYRDPTYWALGGVVTIIGAAGFVGLVDSYATTALAVAAAEVAFGATLFARTRPRPAAKLSLLV